MIILRLGFKKQRGAATLAITLIVLLLITMITLFTARSLVTEQRVSANQYRAEQAESAASAGLDLGTALLNIQRVSVDRNADGDTTDDPGDKLLLEYGPTDHLLTNNSRSRNCPAGAMDLNGDGDTADPGEAPVDLNGDGDTADPGESPLRVVGVTSCDALNSMSPPFTAGQATGFITDPNSGQRLPTTVAFDCRGSDPNKAGIPPELRCTTLPLGIWAFGWSDDGTARHRMTVTVSKTDAISSQPNPIGLTSFSSVDQGGNLKIANFYNDDTIWSGRSVTADGTPETYIRKPGDTTRADCSLTGSDWTNFLAAHAMLASKDAKVGLSADVIENDPNLLALTEDKFWSLYFNAGRDAIRQRAEDLGQNYTSCPSESDLNNRTGIIWIPGGCTFSGTFVVGSFLSPAIFVADGDITLHGGTFNGLTYVEGKLYTNAQTRFNGLVGVEDARPAVGDSTSPGAGVDICVEPGFFSGEKGIIKSDVGLVPGTWRDWRVF